jgi:hypothetical protein
MVTTSVVDDDAITSEESLMEEITAYLYPALRLGGALAVVWFCSTFSKYVQRMPVSLSSRKSCCGSCQLLLVGKQRTSRTHPLFSL